jgi:hypothetical protein
MFQVPLVNPYSCWVVLIVSIWFSILEASQQNIFFMGWGVSPTPNLQPGKPGHPFLSGWSPLTCLSWGTLPAATLLPA